MLLLFVSLLFLSDVSSAPLKTTVHMSMNASDLFWIKVSTSEPNPETLEELVSELKSDECILLEGDIIQSMDRNAVGSIWPTLEIPYDISPELAGRTDDVLAAMAMVSKHTCVNFHRRRTEKDHLLFTTGKGCASYVGFIGGSQPVYIGPRCTVGNVVHEILHALGFHHEHTRTDRNQHVTILHQNILSGREKNFKERDGETFSLPYDIASILHYGRNFFSSNGLPTIVPKNDVQDMGQRVRMSENDIQRVRQLYNCNALRPPAKDGTMKLEDDVSMHNVTTSTTGMLMQ